MSKKAKPWHTRSVRDLVMDVERKFAKKPDGYISHIRFPHFKNIESQTRIDFPFPLSVLVGPNGSGKTSVLHALYGAPFGFSTGDFWFSTACDPIQEGDGAINRFIYGHCRDGTVVETRKARVSKRSKADYWEPTKAVVSDSMNMEVTKKTEGRAADRWLPVRREVLYLNFRSELSAFDKFMFFGSITKGVAIQTKQDAIRARSKHLVSAMDSEKKVIDFYGKNRITRHEELDGASVEVVSQILGRKYTGATLIEHDLYGNSVGKSVRFKRPALKYSEAFAGSGEMAVVSLVNQVERAAEGTLIILDEPEVSLHPGAQRVLLKWLLYKTLTSSHQIVFSTHSPHLVEELPARAVKVFREAPTGKSAVENACHPSVAFSALGIPSPDKVAVFVEDRLGVMVVKAAINRLEVGARQLFDVSALPGGAETYLSSRVSTMMLDTTRVTLLLLDGDKKRIEPADLPDPELIPTKGEEPALVKAIKDTTGLDPSLLPDGGAEGANKSQLNQLRRTYLGYLRKSLRFLPASCPEEILVRLDEPTYSATTSQAAKAKFRSAFERLDADFSQNEMEASAKVKLEAGRSTNPSLQAIETVLREALGRMSSK